MKKHLLAYALLPVLGLGFLGANVASAHGWFWNASPEEIATRQQAMFQSKAEILGISVDELKNEWAQGKTLVEIARAQGISEEELRERMKQAKKDQMRTHLQILVDQGVITQEQAESRLSFMENWLENGKGGRGFHRGFHF